ncbi:M23 family metallopeptidase [Paenarthrobacter sp. NPDC089714]|uniref:M23 family metallopeptidase n=1 Tax=Paenarthrobacter sp. NPDC089714 TaxID=3364377 RepID=UPI00381E5F8D
MTLILARPSRGPVTQYYGNPQPDGYPHAGQDYGYTDGVNVYPEVYAAADGIVLYAGDSRNLGWPNQWYLNPDFNRNDNVDSSAGNVIIIGHKAGGATFIADTGYGHLASFKVKTGDAVRAGQQIAIKGNTGYSFGRHLHFFLMFRPYNYATVTYGCSDPNPYMKGGAALGPAGTINRNQEEDDMYTDTDRARDNLTAERVNYLWDTVGPGKSGYKPEGELAGDIRAGRRAAEAALDSVTPGEFEKRPAGATIQAMVAIAANSQGKTVGEIVDGVAEKLADGVEFTLQTKQEG